MDYDEASQQIAAVDESDHEERAERLVELMDLLPTVDELMGFSGQAARWLFEDLKSTWIYASFTSTVLTAHAFCMLQLANSIRLSSEDANLTEEAATLEELATIAVEQGVIDIELQAQLVVLHDRYRTYAAADLRKHLARLEEHLVESSTLGDEPALLTDARFALNTAIRFIRL
jgi:hypothetical protein